MVEETLKNGLKNEKEQIKAFLERSNTLKLAGGRG
jgi:hypothetical protein